MAASHPPYHTFHAFLSSPKRRTFPHQARGSRLKVHPILLISSFVLCHSFVMALSFHIFHQFCLPLRPLPPSSQPIFPSFAFGPLRSLFTQSFSISHAPETPHVLKVEVKLELDDWRCHVDFSTFKCHTPALKFPSVWVKCWNISVL